MSEWREEAIKRSLDECVDEMISANPFVPKLIYFDEQRQRFVSREISLEEFYELGPRK